MQRLLTTGFAGVLSVTMAGQAVALSCAAPTVEASFAAADAADAQYALAVGKITLLPGWGIPERDANDPEPKGYIVKARFDGNLASTTGFDSQAAFPLTVEVICVTNVCGAVPQEEVLVFVERREGENVLVEGPCPRFALPATPEIQAEAIACVTEGGCGEG